MDKEEPRCLTNAERLRAMTDDEMVKAFLAIWYNTVNEDPPWCSAQVICEKDCGECVLHWLGQVSMP